VVVVAREHLDEVVALTRAIDRESGWLAAIRGGASLSEATGVDDVIRQKRRGAGVELP
jgi:4-hydroxy-4-methyl-2-oxoglutarate aldolase